MTTALAGLELSDRIEVLVYNAVSPTFGKPTTLSSSQLVDDFRVNVAGALVAAKSVVWGMQSRGHGCLLFTGGGWGHYPWDQASSIGIGKAGFRNLAVTLGQELSASGIRVDMVSIMGQVAPGTALDPEPIGEAFLAAYQASGETFVPEVLFKG